MRRRDGRPGGGGSDITEQEPNNERAQATQLPMGGGTFTLHGTCADASDLDYYDAHPTSTGTYSVSVTWTAGSYELAFDPETGLTGQLTRSTMPPLMTAGQLTLLTAQFGIDCYNATAPGGLAGLAYTVTLTLPP